MGRVFTCHHLEPMTTLGYDTVLDLGTVVVCWAEFQGKDEVSGWVAIPLDWCQPLEPKASPEHR